MFHAGPIPSALILAAVLLATTSPLHAQTTWHVDDNAPGDPAPGNPSVSDPLEDGSVAHPYDAIQEAVNTATDGDTVLVRDGIYIGTGNGFIGLGGRSIALRSENGPAGCTIGAWSNAAGRAFHLKGGETPDTIIQGFTIKGDLHGMHIENSSPTVRGCIFLGYPQAIGGSGAAIYNQHSSPRVISCEFLDFGNQEPGAHEAGGAVMNVQSSRPVFTNCLFFGNSLFVSDSYLEALTAVGGAVYSDGSCSPSFDYCVFSDNAVIANSRESTARGGAIASETGCIPRINHCRFLRNSATAFGRTVSGTGGAISGDADIRQSLFVDNTASHGDGSVTGGTIVNSIFWQNAPSVVPGSKTYCLVNINPLFVNPAIDDYRLAAGSPAIDAGDNTALELCAVDLSGNERFVDDPATADSGLGTPPLVDIGPYEFGGLPAADCNVNGVMDPCEPGGSSDCNSNGVPDLCDVYGRTSSDCNGNQSPDECDLAVGTSLDCNENARPDECETDCNANGIADLCDTIGGTSEDCNANAIPDECEIAIVGSPFPTRLAENTTGYDDAIFTGPPDDAVQGIGGQFVTYAFDTNPALNGPGPDLTVYEVDGGTPEFDLIDVLVSMDGSHFVSVKASETEAIDIPGDEAHGSNDFARSYELAAAAMNVARFIRIDGNGTASAGGGAGFDLDAIGVVYVYHPDCNGNEVPDECEPGGSSDCNTNGVPDWCEPVADCNANGTQDICDIAAQPHLDCDGNFVLDACEGLYACDPPIPAHCPDGDVHCDGVVNGLDVAYIISSGTWGMPTCEAAYPRADCNHDGMVNGLDVAMCVSSSCWGL